MAFFNQSRYGSEASTLAGAVADGMHGHLGSTEHREPRLGTPPRDIKNGWL
jgi:hypothetical protein